LSAFPGRGSFAFPSSQAFAWAAYAASLGFAGGATFEEHPALGLALGFALALVGTSLISLAVRKRGTGDATDASA
jgi:hypothetical protein